MKIISYYIIFLNFFQEDLVAQFYSIESINQNYKRNQQLLSEFDSCISFTTQTNSISETSILNWKKTYIKLLPFVFKQQLNSHHPFGWNYGAMIQSKGYQVLARPGVNVQYGLFEVQLAPELVFATNDNFATPQFGNSSNKSYTKVFPGQSFIKANYGAISVGVSSQNLWWGPGNKNALIMCTNAPGFLHWSVETNQPIQASICAFEGQIIGGELTNSGIEPPRTNSVYNGNFVYQPKPNKTRYMTGMVLSWGPKLTPNLYLGFAKSSYLYSADITSPLDYLPLQGFFGKSIIYTEKNKSLLP